MKTRLPVYIGEEAISELIGYCKAQSFSKFLLVSDEHTYAALGKAVEEALREQGFEVVLARLAGEEVIADEKYLVQVFLKADKQERTFIAVGSGTITDITRFVSHRNRSSFIAMPTAPSVDGFNSIGAPLVAGGLKQTIPCQAPIAVFAHLPTLCAAPPLLIASGLGDMVGKLLSIADWKLGHILWDEPYNEQILQRVRKAAFDCVDHVNEIGRGTEEGVRYLIDGLIESGFGMLEFGNSNPASGAEHHISHFWEMKLLREHRPPIFHGIKVGLASIYTAGWYQTLRSLRKEEIASRLDSFVLPDTEEQIRGIRAVFGPVAEEIISDQSSFIYMSEQTLARLKGRILDHWEGVLEIAAAVPAPDQIVGWLRTGGGPVSNREIGLDDEEVQLGLEYGHYLRKRFTINKLRHLLNIQ